MAIFNSSDLDFDNIKSKLKVYFQQQPEFADYNFEASGLSNILDVLAYNTHLNGLIANFSLNESFLATAQLRSNVVSHAETLGYIPRSKTSSKATVNLSVSITDTNRPYLIELPAYTQFTASVDDKTYTYQTIEQYLAYDDGNGLYVFKNIYGSENIQIYEGTKKTKTFLVGEVSDTQVYVIPDTTIDTKTLTVNVYDTPTSSTFTAFKNISEVVRIDASTTIYQIKEVPNGYYEVQFGDGSVLGASPKPGNKIVISYLSTVGNVANDASEFAAVNDLRVNGVDYPVYVVTVENSTGGSDKEGIDSIKRNATLAFASQQRMVTAEDYKSQILASYSSYLTDVIAWGGHDNYPPVYGRVYVGLKFIDSMTDEQKQIIKDSIINNLTKNLSIMSIDTVFTDPVNVYLELITPFNFDPSLTNVTVREMESQVQNTILDYFNNNLKKFGQVFRRSTILSEVDKISSAILNSKMDVKIQMRINPDINVITNYSLSYPVQLASPDDVNYIIRSSTFIYGTQLCYIRNRLTSTDLEIASTSGEVVLDNIGSYNPSTGVLQLISFNPQAVSGDALKISAIPENQATIKPLRNYILDIDTSLSAAKAIIDYQNIKVTL